MRSSVLAQKHSVKTQSAICLMCLFNGLRSQSIRRLVRRPLTVCSQPFLIFDPSYYSPSSERIMNDLYMSTVKCPCEVTVDPSVSTVFSLLAKHSSSIPPQRIIIHFFGQGTHTPSDEGDVYFFTDTRERYKPMKIQQFLSTCSCPLTFIFDCANAASLKPHLMNRRDVFAFFATSPAEDLQTSVDAPLDLFTSCLLQHFDTAMWFYHQRHRSIFDENVQPSDKSVKLLKPLLEAILDTIIFDTQTSETYELFSADPAVSHLFRGFVLSQRVMPSFNVHPDILPEVNPMNSHNIWTHWDIAIDIILTSSEDEAIHKIFKIFIESFETFPLSGYLPLFTLFLTLPETNVSSADHLLRFADSSDNAIEQIARSSIPKLINEIEKPEPTFLCVIAKVIAFTQKNPIEPSNHPFFKSNASSDINQLKYEMICAYCMLLIDYQNSYQKHSLLFIKNAKSCAPFSVLLMGIILSNLGTLESVPPYENAFLDLLNSERSDIRAASIFALSFTRNKNQINYIFEKVSELANDHSPIVRIQVIYCLISFSKQNLHDGSIYKKIYNLLLKFNDDPDNTVKNVFTIFNEKTTIMEQIKNDKRPTLQIINPITAHFLASCRAPGFENRVKSDVFNAPMPNPQVPSQQSPPLLGNNTINLNRTKL